VKKEERQHGAQKPVELLSELIKLSSLPGDLVLDPFAGSFSTLVAAKATGRRGIGIEKDRAFVDLGLVSIFNDTGISTDDL
jgi:DNA modification methylase